MKGGQPMYYTTTTTHVIQREDGTIKSQYTTKTVKHMQTQKDWNKQHRKLRRTAKGSLIEWYTGYGSSKNPDTACARMYEEAETLPMTEREIVRYDKQMKTERKKKREEAKERKKAREEEEARLQAEAESSRLQTAWQWLSAEHRVPVKGATAHGKINTYFDGEDFQESDKIWYYYYKRDTREASDEEYERLKALYTEKFGGWETIDLEHTPYDGHIWWDD